MPRLDPPTASGIQEFNWRFFKDWFYKLWQNVRGFNGDGSGNVTLTGNLTVVGNINGTLSYSQQLAIYTALILP